jgi:hypothetical protein
VLPLATVIVTMASIEIGQTFSSLATAKAAIKLAISEQLESFIIDYSDKTRFRIMCLMRTQSNCEFEVRATDSKKHGVNITHAKPHTCSPATHFQARNTHAVKFKYGGRTASIQKITRNYSAHLFWKLHIKSLFNSPFV